jgi:tRNA threonylcarbamoyladenosine biosynthesis protein TsaE
MPEVVNVVNDLQFGLDKLDQVAKEVIQEAKGLSIWLIDGEMGAGKTTLVKAVAKELGIKQTVASPTFSIVNEYSDQHGKPIYHFDFYRLKNEMEAYDIGVNEYFDSGNLCWVEWSEKIPTLLPKNYFRIVLEVNDPHTRTIHYARH